jgi:predicted tellurium resistance membrane protein TerC
MDSNFISQYLLPILLVAVLEIALFADNITALKSLTNNHSEANQKKIIRWALVWGCPVNFGLIFLVIYLHDIPEIQDYVHLGLGLALVWVFWKGYSELSSLEDEEMAAIEEANATLIGFKSMVRIVGMLQIQSVPFYFDSVPLASSISHSLIIISCGIMLSRLVIILLTNHIVDFFATNKNVNWGVMIFILLSAFEDLSVVVGDISHLFASIDLNIPQELGMLVGSVILGLLTWKYIDPETKGLKSKELA